MDTHDYELTPYRTRFQVTSFHLPTVPSTLKSASPMRHPPQDIALRKIPQTRSLFYQLLHLSLHLGRLIRVALVPRELPLYLREDLRSVFAP